MLVVQACLTLQLRELSPAGSSGHGVLQGGMLEWAAMPFSRGPFLSRGRSHVSSLQADSSPSEPRGSPVRAWRRHKTSEDAAVARQLSRA